MKNVRYQRLLRLGTRGLELTQAPNPALAIGLIGEPLLSTHQSLQKFTDVLRELEAMVSAQMSKSRQAQKALGKEYDNARVVVASARIQAPMFSSSTQYRVPEDQLEAARQLIASVSKEQEQAWAQQILPALTCAYDSAVQCRAEDLSNRASLQKAQSEARAQADTLDTLLISLRLAVRTVFGSKSREYQMIRAVKLQGDQDESPAPVIELPAATGNNSGQRAA